MFFFSPSHNRGKVIGTGRSDLNVPFFLHFASASSFKVRLVGLLCEKVKQYPVLYDKKIEG